MPVQIRPIEPSDVDLVVEIALRAWEPVHASMAVVLGEQINRRVYPDWAAGQELDVRNACADPRVQAFVATEGRTILGFVSIMIDAEGHVGEIDMIAVDPRHQRHGVARRLTDFVLDAMRDAGCTLVHVATGGDSGHAAARGLYEATGFTGLPLVRYYRSV